ncbi:putative pyruvate formate lyase activating enzyme [Methanolinea mesophila]|uniref:radical SAM protein n=1 Tax=Methanolinea mesophila TaxID=547055 RepID=UPI001AE943F3|nr:radical SAM protein [Methanolinea mesophila]MBP1927915.1 putative pyruvate formate lyase activating enzyme [Methanolinea mesophila]
MSVPAYLETWKSGELAGKVERALSQLDSCTVCPRDCAVDRAAGEHGYCGIGQHARIASYGPHFGEERPLVGRFGSGTIFFSGCHMRCRFCQNYQISQLRYGSEVSAPELARIMLELQDRGCININLVSPSHVVPQILESLPIAVEGGLSIPLVYNTGTFDRIGTLELLHGVVDIYMPDAKYGSDEIARDLSDAPGYTEIMHAALKEMYRQVGNLKTENGIATRGMIIRHLVLPGDLAGSGEVMRFIAREISTDAYVNIMDQYYPSWKAKETGYSGTPHESLLGRRITDDEYRIALEIAKKEGLHRGFPGADE